MKKMFLVLFIITIAMIGIVSAAISTLPAGEQGYYDITSSPSGAAVSVDSTPYGTTPTTATVIVSGAGHTIAVNMVGYQPWSKYYSDPAAGQHIAVNAVLVPIPTPTPTSTPIPTATPAPTPTPVQTGNILVNSVPNGASAILDNGYNQLTTAGTFTAVSTGWHNVEVSKSGYQLYSTTIEVKTGVTSTVSATLVPNQQIGSISVSSLPVGASLYVDTIYQGLTNQIVGNLAAGPHTITLKKSGYQDYSQSATVNNAQTTYLSITLSPLSSPTTGDLDVTSSPSGASVYLNGAYKGTTYSSGPLYITGLSPGAYSTVLKKSGYQDYSTTTNIVAGTTAKISAVLQPASATPTTASAEINSQPSGADVYINNAYKGVTPLSFENVPIDATKTYKIEIRLAGYNSYTDSGSVSPGQNIVINAALTSLTSVSQPASKSSTWLIVGVIAIIIVIGAVAYFMMQKKKP